MSSNNTAFAVAWKAMRTEAGRAVALALQDHGKSDDPAYRRAALDLLREQVGNNPAGRADAALLAEVVGRMEAVEQ